MSKIAGAILNALAGAAEPIVEEALANVLRKIQPKEKRDEILAVLYVPVDTELEPLANATKTNLDDLGVDALKGAIETVAAEDSFTLPNLDND